MEEKQHYVEIEVTVTRKVPLQFPIDEFEKTNIVKRIENCSNDGQYPITVLEHEKDFLKRNPYFDAFANTDNTIVLLQRNLVGNTDEFTALKQIGYPKEFRIVSSQDKQKTNTIAQSIDRKDNFLGAFLHCPVQIHPDLVMGFKDYYEQKTKNIPFNLDALPHIQLVMPINTDFYPNTMIRKVKTIICSYMCLLNGGYDQTRDDAPCEDTSIDINPSQPREINYFATSNPSMWWIDTFVEPAEGTILLDPITISALQFQEHHPQYVQFLEG